jgi:O-antigen/teichoic acid export membrane protein
LRSRFLDPLASIADQGAAAAVGFLASVFVGRTLGAAALGLFAVTTVVLLALNGVQNALVLQGLSVLAARVPAGEARSYRAAVFWLDRCLAAGLLALGSLLIVTVGGLLGWNFGQVAAFLAAHLYFFFLSLQNLLRRQLYLDRRPLGALLQSCSFVVLALLGLAALAAGSAVSVTRVYLVLAASSALVCIAQSRLWRGQREWPGGAALLPTLERHWRFGRWILLAIPFVLGTYQGYYLLVGYQLSWEAAGTLRAAEVLVLPFEKLEAREQRRWCARLAALLAAFGLAYGLVLLAAGERFVVRLFGEELAGSAPLLPFLCALPLVHALVVPANILLMALLLPERNLASRVAATVVTLVAGSYLVSAYAVRGAAAGLVLSAVTFTALLWLGVLRHWTASLRGARMSSASRTE